MNDDKEVTMGANAIAAQAGNRIPVIRKDYYMRRIERCTCPRCGAVHNKKLEAGR